MQSGKSVFHFQQHWNFSFFGSEISAVCCTFVPFCIYHVHVKKKLLSILRKQSWPINIPTHLSEIVHGHNFVATPEKPSRQPWFDRSGSGLKRGKFFITPFPFAFYARQNCMQSVGEQSSAWSAAIKLQRPPSLHDFSSSGSEQCFLHEKRNHF